ncbi:SUMF1/EgtB/PvdO family nonheme iron enzyme [Sphingomonas sp. dw_22]|uniref:SUMF1/EgtB/PvdO family nonheme iron enzyme n=1 Tax=Sphingomonas sp. dw_22 TaxID=2721175 RepID=UPI001BD2E76E|nr:SUMF1/EgtB/PvdO family nonheme iron enzyme [Sphingomonas sp. dw_22]
MRITGPLAALLGVVGVVGTGFALVPPVAPAAPASVPAKCAGSRVDRPVIVKATDFMMGSTRHYAEEGPSVRVSVTRFDIDAHEVTNRQYAAFAAATGYVTEAERPGGGAFVFSPPATPVEAPDPRLWWRYVKGANWRHPAGPDSDIAGRDDDPVVNVTYADALAYARWAGRALPSEEQFEAAARAGGAGEEGPVPGTANIWQGGFPDTNEQRDGFYGRAPAGCFKPDADGAYDLIGNVWEWTGSWYLPTHGPIVTGDGTPGNPSFDPAQPDARVRVIKGGSFLCAANYCARYRPAARHAQDETLAASHLGFRTVSTSGE